MSAILAVGRNIAGTEGMLGNELRLKNLKIQALWLTLLLPESCLMSLYLLMYKRVSSGICRYLANYLKIWGLKIVCYFISCFCRLTGHNWQFSLGSLESCKQIGLTSFRMNVQDASYLWLAGDADYGQGSSVRVINCGHSMWLGFSKHEH